MNLSPSDILDLADAGAGASAALRALLLAQAVSGAPFDDVAALTIGQRNALVLHARRAVLGEKLECRVACPACGESLEFTANVAALLPEQEPQAGTFELAIGELLLKARIPTGGDLLAIVGEAASAREALVARCVLDARVNGDALDALALPEPVLAALAEALHSRDPLIETLFDMDCPACAHRWQASFEIAGFVWQEFAAYAERLLGEIHALAHAYGWSEAVILAMNPRRRRRYVDMVAT